MNRLGIDIGGTKIEAIVLDSNNEKQFCGNGNFADLSIFSFHPVKHIAAGEGGMITTNSEELYNKLLKLRTHGITKNAGEYLNSMDVATGESDSNHEEYPGWYMEMVELGEPFLEIPS